MHVILIKFKNIQPLSITDASFKFFGARDTIYTLGERMSQRHISWDCHFIQGGNIFIHSHIQ